MAKERMPWDRLEDEDDLWYERFEIFRQLGAIRSIAQTYRIAQRERPELTGKSPNSTWSEKVAKYRWLERARAWDDYQREQFRAKELEIAEERRMARLQMIKELEKDSFIGLQNANIASMNQAEARAYLPQIRMLLVALLGIERVELGGPTGADDQPSSDLPDEIIRNLEKSFGSKVSVGNGVNGR